MAGVVQRGSRCFSRCLRMPSSLPSRAWSSRVLSHYGLQICFEGEKARGFISPARKLGHPCSQQRMGGLWPATVVVSRQISRSPPHRSTYGSEQPGCILSRYLAPRHRLLSTTATLRADHYSVNQPLPKREQRK